MRILFIDIKKVLGVYFLILVIINFAYYFKLANKTNAVIEEISHRIISNNYDESEDLKLKKEDIAKRANEGTFDILNPVVLVDRIIYIAIK